MLGICGLVAHQDFDECLPAFERALIALAPDNPAKPLVIRATAPCALGQQTRRQAIKSTAIPPLAVQMLVADVRLDNREALQPLLAPLHPEADDVELLAAAFARWGKHCIRHLRGEYAVAIWDQNTRELFCFRDPLGHRPLYYTWQPGHFAFASQVKSLLPIPWVSGEMEAARLGEFLSSLSVGVDPNLTYFRNIFRVLPGSTLTFSTTGIVMQSYWLPDPRRALPPHSTQDYLEEFRDLFKRALMRRIGNHSQVGLCLSGGFDSSCIAISAAELLAEQGNSLHAFVSVASKGLAAAPVETIKICDALKRRIPNLELHFQDQEQEPLLVDPELNGIADAPLGPLGQRLHLLFRKARNLGMDVMLTGYGGDHAVSPRGAGFLYDLLTQGQWRTLFHETQARARLANVPIWRTVFSELVVPKLPRWLWHGMLHLRDGTPPWREHMLCTAEFLQSVGILNTVKKHPSRGFRRRAGMRAASCEGLEYVQSGRGFDETFNLAWHSSLELSRPLLDLDLVEFSLALPPHLHVRNGQRRTLLRDAFGEAIPRELAQRSERNDFIIPDIGAMTAAQQPVINQALNDLEDAACLSQIVDLARLRRLNGSWSGDPLTDMRTAMLLLRGISGARFAHWVSNNNVPK